MHRFPIPRPTLLGPVTTLALAALTALAALPTGCRSDDIPVPATPEARAEHVAALERSRDETRAQLVALIQEPAPGTEPDADERRRMDPELRKLAEELERIERALAAVAAAEAAERDPDARFTIERR